MGSFSEQLWGDSPERRQRRADLTTNLDLVPTLVTAAGGQDPDLDGLPLHHDGACGGRDDVLVQISESHIGRALRTRTHTLGVAAVTRNPLAGHLRPAASRYRVTHLYDDARDPHQRTNLVRDPGHQGLVTELAGRLGARIGVAEGRVPVIIR